MLLLIFCDTLTRWDCIVKRYILDHDEKETDIRLIKLSRVIVQFFRNETWSENYLTSRAFSRICEKMLIYGLALTIFFLAGQWLPEFHLFGVEIVPKNVFPGTITMVLFLIEISSINENLIEFCYNKEKGEISFKTIEEMFKYFNDLRYRLIDKNVTKLG